MNPPSTPSNELKHDILEDNSVKNYLDYQSERSKRM